MKAPVLEICQVYVKPTYEKWWHCNSATHTFRRWHICTFVLAFNYPYYVIQAHSHNELLYMWIYGDHHSSKTRSTFSATRLQPDVEYNCVLGGKYWSSSATFLRSSSLTRWFLLSRLSLMHIFTCVRSMGRKGTKALMRFLLIRLLCHNPPETGKERALSKLFPWSNNISRHFYNKYNITVHTVCIQRGMPETENFWTDEWP